MPASALRSRRLQHAAALAGATALVAGAIVAAPAIAAAPAEPAVAADVACDQLAAGLPCTLTYEEYPGFSSVSMPAGVTDVTVVLAGAAGAPGSAHAADPGPGAIIIATIEVSSDEPLHVWLGEQPTERHGGAIGWASGGDGGDWDTGNDGRGGGAASALTYASNFDDVPLLVAGGGGGGGGSDVGLAGGVGGFGGLPAGDGADGKGRFFGSGGRGGHQSGTGGGNGGGSQLGIDVGAGGGGGGGGYHGGSGGGYALWTGSYGGFNSAGGGGGGTSYAYPGVNVLGYGTAPLGPGFVTFYPGVPDAYYCDGTDDGYDITVPDDVIAYSVFAFGGAGGFGSNKAHGGMGALVTGVVFVDGIDELQAWAGCSGDRSSGAGEGWADGGDPGRAPNPEAHDGGRGGGATALATGEGTMLVVAGGGGGAGGDIANCYFPPGPQCGGLGGSGGGDPRSSLPADGVRGDGGDGGHGGLANAHVEDGQPITDGGHGVDPGGLAESGAGGGGGGGYPMGGNGGHHEPWDAGGGGGAGGSYANSQYVTDALITTAAPYATNEDVADGFILLAPIKRVTRDLTVHKEVTGGADGYAHPPFWMHVQCTLFDHVVVDRTFSLGIDDSHTLSVPEGASCTIEETTTGGASDPAPPHTVLISGETLVTMTNRFTPTDLVLTVRSEMVDHNGESNDSVHVDPGDIAVSVTCTVDGALITLPAPAVDGVVTFDGSETFSTDGVSHTLTGLPEGALCSVLEIPGAGATRTEYVINGRSEGEINQFELEPDSNTVSISNEYELAELPLQKYLDGDTAPPPDATFAGDVTCTFHGNPVVFDDPRTFTGLTVGGTVTVTDLPVGALCTVTETETASADAIHYVPAQTVRIDPTGTQMQIVNTYDSGALIVRVEASGPGMPWANADYSVHVTCTIFNGETEETVLDDTFTTGPSGGWKSYLPLEGASCTAVEEADGGATAVRYWSSADSTPSSDPVSVTVGADSALTVHNTFSADPISVSVTTSGPGERFAEPFTVTVDGCTFNGELIDIAPDAHAVALDFGPEGGIAAIPELVTGASCTATLTDEGGATTVTVAVDGGAPVDADSAGFTVHEPRAAIAFDAGFEVAALDVRVQLAGDAAWAANTAYAVRVECTLDGAPITELGTNGVLLSFEPDGTAIGDAARELLGALPVGAECTTTELEDGGASSVEVDTSPVVLGLDGASVTVTNTFDPSTLTVAKEVGGNAAAEHADDVFWFEVGCTFNGLPIGNPPTDPLRPLTFSLSNGQAAEFPDRPVGADCTVVETYDGHATSVTPDTTQTAELTDGGTTVAFVNTFDVAALTVAEELSGPGAATYGQPQVYPVEVICRYPDGSRASLADFGQVWLDAGNDFTATLEVPVGTTCTAEQPRSMATRQTVSEPVPILLGGEHTITITSVFELGPITVAKTALGDYPATQEFVFDVACVWPDDEQLLPLDGDAPPTFALRSGQERTVDVLSGARCAVTETGATGALRIDSNATGRDAESDGATASVLAWHDEPARVAVTNYMPGSLPITGPEAAAAIAVLGLALLVGGGAVLGVRAVRRKG